jgi:hypothetical protein
MGQGIVDPQRQSPADDFGLGEVKQGGMDAEAALPFYRRPGGEIGHRFKGGDVLGAAVGITRVVEGVDADEEVEGAEHLGPAKGEGEEDSVARRHIGDRDDPFFYSAFGHRLLRGQGAAADPAQIEIDHQVLFDPDLWRILLRLGQFHCMPLAIGEAHGAGGEPFGPGDRQTGGGVESAAVENYRFICHRITLDGRQRAKG